MKDLTLLTSLGLTKTEAQLYLSSLELGPATAIQLGQKLSLTRQLMYNLLPGLMERGFIKRLTIGRRHFFQAVDPEILADKANQLQREVTKAIPLLRQRQASNNAVPLITIYDNPLAMREWYRQFMQEAKKGEEKLVYSSEVGWFELDPEFYGQFASFQIRKGTHNRIVAPDTAAVREVARQVVQAAPQVHEYRFAPEGWAGESGKWIWRNQVVLFTQRGKASNLIVVESEELAAVERFAFERVWRSLED